MLGVVNQPMGIYRGVCLGLPESTEVIAGTAVVVLVLVLLGTTASVSDIPIQTLLIGSKADLAFVLHASVFGIVLSSSLGFLGRAFKGRHTITVLAPLLLAQYASKLLSAKYTTEDSLASAVVGVCIGGLIVHLFHRPRTEAIPPPPPAPPAPPDVSTGIAEQLVASVAQPTSPFIFAN